VERLRDEKARWQDPAYVERQAREHLQYVRPGETGFLLPREEHQDDSDSESESSEESEDGAAGAERLRDSDAAVGRPWYDNLWDGIDRADEPR
jgi:hypothetical protein